MPGDTHSLRALRGVDVSARPRNILRRSQLPRQLVLRHPEGRLILITVNFDRLTGRLLDPRSCLDGADIEAVAFALTARR